MILLDIYSGIETYFKDNWHHSKIGWENSTLKIDSDPVIQKNGYVRITHLPTMTEHHEIGGRNRFDCITVIDCFERNGRGKRRIAEYASEVAELFKINTVIPTVDGLNIHCLVPEPQPAKDDGHGFFMLPVHCPWYVFYT